MGEYEINYRILRKIQQMEKNSPVLTELNPSFYNILSEYLENLNNRLEKETSIQKQILLREEIQNTKKIVTNIYEQREKKILLVTISKARGGNPNLKNMLNVEKNLFETVLGIMLESRKKFLEFSTKENKIDVSKPVELTDKEKYDKKKENSNPIVRVIKDIPEFIGTDEKKYYLRNNDVLSLPGDMSDLLSKRGVVKNIK